MAPAVVDLTADGVPDVVFSTFGGGNYTTDGHLRAVNGGDGTEIFTVSNSSYDVRGAGSVTVGDIDGDGRPEILVCDESGSRIIAFEHDGTYKWRSPMLPGGGPKGSVDWGSTALADVDHDEEVEIIIGDSVLNADGTIRWTGGLGRGDNGAGPLALVADLDLDGDPEVMAGNTAYNADGGVYWHNGGLSDGFNAVANFDDDPFPEVVLVTEQKVYLLEHDGTIKWGPLFLPGSSTRNAGGPPTVADVDGDGELEIGVAGGYAYAVYAHDGTLEWSQATQDLSSNRTGSSVFDFEGDGSVEIVYSDELMLRIYRGTDGTVVWDTPSPSGTACELPIIADVDADGNAEIVMVSNNYRISGFAGITVYGDSNDNWVATRTMWNQHTYHITNVNDDATIPAIEENNWLFPPAAPFNNYRQNVQTVSSALAASDLTASYVRTEATETATYVTARIGNGGANMVGVGVPVSYYEGEPVLGNLLGTVYTSLPLEPGAFEDVTLTLPSGTTTELTVWVVADDPGDLTGFNNECNEVNNAHDSGLVLGPFNHPPELDPIGDQTVDEGDTLVVPVSASDPDGDPIALSASGLPPFASFVDHANGTGTLTIAPGIGDAGVYPGVTITAATSDPVAGPSVPGFVVETYATLDAPSIMSFDPTGVLYVGNNTSDGGVHIYRIGVGGTPIEEYGESPIIDGDTVLFDEVGAISGTAGSVLVGGHCAVGNGCVSAVLPDETVIPVWGPTTVFKNPISMTFDNAGRLLMADGYQGQGQVVVSEAGESPTTLLSYPEALI